jgi:SP family facilitated glucose transporter-like MFS transporter 8
MLISGFMTFGALGNITAYSAGAYVNWKTLALICGGLPLALAPLLCFLPESPTKLIQNGNEEEAMKSMIWLRGESYPSCADEIQDIKRHMEEAEQRQPSYR